MNKQARALRYATLVLLFLPVLSLAQGTCGLSKALSVSEVKGKVLFNYNGALFTVRGADVNLNYKGELAFEGIANTSTDINGRFHLNGIKPGEYFLSIHPARLPIINLMKINIVAGTPAVADSEIEFVIGSEWQKECGGGYVRTILSPEERVAGKSDVPEADEISEISLEHTGCFGSCPIDKVILRKDGTATYFGKDYVTRKGTYQGKMKYGFPALAELIYRSGFFNLKDKYEAPYTDLDTSIVSVVRNGERKTVINYGREAPIEVWGIEKTIEALVEDIQWEEPQVTPKKRRGSRR